MSLTAEQVRQLLRPIDPRRVMRLDNHSHLAQQDVTAHLSRIFGFAGWDKEVLELAVVFDVPVTWMKDGREKSGFDVTYRCQMRLTVKDPDGQIVAVREDGATGSAVHQPSRAGAHDLAMKAAISYALKRCAKDWGDQFGLSLYNGGQIESLVRGTLVTPAGETKGQRDLQRGVPQQVADEDGGAFEQRAQEHAAVQQAVILEQLHAQNFRGPAEGVVRYEGAPPPSMFEEFATADAAMAEEEGAPTPDAQKLAVFLEQVKLAADYAELREVRSDAKAAAGVDAITPRGWELVRVAANLRREELLAAMEQASEAGV